jgi:hypothetical protein
MKYFNKFIYYETSKDKFTNSLKVVFSFLLISYSLKSANVTLLGIDLVLLVWLLFSLYLSSIIKEKSVIIAALIYSILACFYILGDMRSSNSDETLGYIRIFPTGFILAAIISEKLNKISRTSLVRGFLFVNKIDIFMLTAIVYWIVFIAKAQSVVDYAVREYGATNYLTISDLLALLCLLVIGDSKNNIITRGAWLVAGLVAMMMLGSRASVIVFGFIALLSISIVNLDNRYKLSIKHIITSLILIILIIYSFFYIFNETITYRMETLIDLGNDQSAMSRNILLEIYLSSISTDPTCLIIACQPPIGNYSHNIFSIIQYFGFVGIILIISGSILIGLAFSKGWKPWGITIFAYSLIQLIFFRAWTSMIFPIIIAYLIFAFLFLSKKIKF